MIDISRSTQLWGSTGVLASACWGQSWVREELVPWGIITRLITHVPRRTCPLNLMRNQVWLETSQVIVHYILCICFIPLFIHFYITIFVSIALATFHLSFYFLSREIMFHLLQSFAVPSSSLVITICSLSPVCQVCNPR